MSKISNISLDVNKNLIPNHVALIMDGNARWAQKRNLPISAGHKQGSKAIKIILEEAIKNKIKYLTIFAFSTENWQRPKSEIEDLIKLMNNYLDHEAKKFIESDVKIIISGSLENLDQKTRLKITNLEEKTQNNKAITLNVAFDYGARKEIIDAIKKIIGKVDNNTQINEDFIKENLYHPEVPDPDLIIRTSGEKRLSNFLLWQAAYSELYFTDTLWPDFGKEDFQIAIKEFNNRKRNYGSR
jgi:undecaprenyl diphosphate synthase